MIKLKLKNLHPLIQDYMSEHFALFDALIDGKTELYVLSNANSIQDIEEHFSDSNQTMPLMNKSFKEDVVIYGFAAVSQSAEYHTLDAIEVELAYRGHHCSKRLLDDVIYDCSMADKPLVLKLSKQGKKALVPSLDFLALKYQVYIMDIEEYEELRAESSL